MDQRISIKKSENFVYSYVTGPISEELLAELMTKLSIKGKEWGFNRYLSDLKQTEKQMGITEDYDFAYNQAMKYGFNRIIPDMR
jgi:hypothetical protein